MEIQLTLNGYIKRIGKSGRIVLVMSVASLGAIFILTKSWESDRYSATISGPSVSSLVDKQLREFKKFVISPSPDGLQVVSWAKHEHSVEREGLIVSDVVTGKIIYEMRSTDPVLRVNWSPNGDKISYFRTQKGSDRRRLFVWELETGLHREIQTPLTNTQQTIRWSPDGAKIAFLSAPGGIVVADVGGGEAVSYEEKVYSFDWSGDSAFLAMITAGRSENIIRILKINGQVTQTLRPRVCNQVYDIAWQHSRKLLVCGVATGEDFEAPRGRFNIISIDPESGAEEVLVSTKDDVRELSWLPGGDGFLWHQHNLEEFKKIVFCKDSASKPIVVALDGELNFRTFLPAMNSMIIWKVSPSSNRLVQIRLSDAAMFSFAEWQAIDIPDVSFQLRMIAGSDGKRVPILLSSNTAIGEETNAVVIRMHGGSRIALAETWAETQIFLSYGVTSIHIPNRGSGSSKDLIAASNFARLHLNVPGHRIVALGSSEGATRALEGVLLAPKDVGILAVIGVTRMPNFSPESRSEIGFSALRVLGFHGAGDPYVPPDRARDILESVLGREALLKPKGMWHVFEQEGHSLRTDKSYAIVHATILQALSLVECDPGEVDSAFEE